MKKETLITDYEESIADMDKAIAEYKQAKAEMASTKSGTGYEYQELMFGIQRYEAIRDVYIRVVADLEQL